MFYMMSNFDLADGISADEVSSRLERFTSVCLSSGLILSASGLGRRVRHDIMDTDDRSFAYCFELAFRDQEHCDEAVERFQRPEFPERREHLALFSAIDAPTFFCWDDG